MNDLQELLTQTQVMLNHRHEIHDKIMAELRELIQQLNNMTFTS